MINDGASMKILALFLSVKLENAAVPIRLINLKRVSLMNLGYKALMLPR